MVGSITKTVTINLVAKAQFAGGGAAAMVYRLMRVSFTVAEALYKRRYPAADYEQTLPHTAKVLHEARVRVLDSSRVLTLRTQLLRQQEYAQYNVGNASRLWSWPVCGARGGMSNPMLRC